MSNNWTIAGAVRRRKEDHPDLYCKRNGCLYRLPWEVVSKFSKTVLASWKQNMTKQVAENLVENHRRDGYPSEAVTRSEYCPRHAPKGTYL